MASVGKYTMPWIIDRAISALLLTNSWPGLRGHIILKNISANMATPVQLHLCSRWGTLFFTFSPMTNPSAVPGDSNERLRIYSHNGLSLSVGMKCHPDERNAACFGDSEMPEPGPHKFSEGEKF